MGLTVEQQRERTRAQRPAPEPMRVRSQKPPASVPTKWGMANRASLLAKQNRAETHVENTLKASGLLHVREYAMRHNNKEFFMDFVVEVGYARVGIEVDGGKHMDPIGQAKDRVREKALFDSGEVTHVVRFSWARALAMDKYALRTILLAFEQAPCRSVTLLY